MARMYSPTTNPEQLERIREAIIRASLDREFGQQAEVRDLWHDFFAMYDPLLQRFASSAGCPPSSEEDIVSEVWKEVHKRLPGFQYDRERGRFRQWLHTIVKHKAIDFARKFGRRSKVEVQPPSTLFLQEFQDPRAAMNPDAHEMLFADEELAIVWEIYERDCETRKAGPTECKVMQRRLFQYLSFAQIATELGIEEDTARMHYSRGAKRLRVIWDERFGPPGD
ncbi:MAG: sigma-70 family RNA polymerase sigma factor [Pirellulales bacterium]